MDFLNDIIYVNKEVGLKTIHSFKKNWFIIFTGIIYTLLNIIIYSIMDTIFSGPLYILSGIVAAIITSAMISNYLYLLFNIINYNRVTLDDFRDGFLYFLRKLYGVLFIAYVARLLLSYLSPILGGLRPLVGPLIYLSLFVLLNPLPETIYLKYYNSWESIVESLEFMRENWLNWSLPNIVFMTLLYKITGRGYINIFTTHISFGFNFEMRAILMYLLAQLIFSIMMIYRGHLYKLLSTSTRRKRIFMKKL